MKKSNIIDEIYKELFNNNYHVMHTNADKYIYKKTFSVKHLSIVESFVFINYFNYIPNNDEIKKYIHDNFQTSLKEKILIPRSLGSGIYVYSIFLAEDFSEDNIEFLDNFSSFHLAAFEIPILISETKMKYYINRKFNFWGGLYYYYNINEIKNIMPKLLETYDE